MESSRKTNKEEFSVAVPASLNQQLCQHLIREDGQEDVAFGLYYPSFGAGRYTALLHRIILPEEGDREVHGNVDIYPQYFKRACQLAMQEGAGVMLMHSHPFPGWQSMSKDDTKTELGYASTAETLTSLPFVGMTVGNDQTWSARVWEYENEQYSRKWASIVRVVGNSLGLSYADHLRPAPRMREIYKRTVTVWGEESHSKLARVRVGIVGLGSVGSFVAESLARMGVERFMLLDYDEVQEHNLDRLLGATIGDIGRAKVHVAKRQIEKAATAENIEVNVVCHGVTESKGYQAALDCDVLFSCVDKPWARYVLNHIAYNHLIPVIDGGIRVRFDSKKRFEGAEWQAQAVGLERPCLECLDVYNSSDVTNERDGKLEDPSYFAGLPDDHYSKRNENIFPFSANLASLEVIHFIEMITGIGGADYFGTQRYRYNQGYISVDTDKRCHTYCDFVSGIATGDEKVPNPCGVDLAANKARLRQDV